MRTIQAFYWSFLVFMAATCSYARSTGAPPGRTGAPPGDTCTACHAGTANSGSGSIRLEFPDAAYTPGGTYRIRIRLADGAASRWGFQITARQGSERTQRAGEFAVADSNTTQFSPGSTPGEYVTHTPAGTFAGTSGSATWEVNWTAPPAGSGPVTFYAAGNAANSNNVNSGDSIYTTSLTVNEGSGTVTGKSYVMAQVAYGGGWFTGMYFTNTGTAAATVGVRFYDPGGNSWSVPLAGVGPVSNHTVTISPNGTALLEALNSGALQQGWAEVTLPPNVSGYGVFRQSVSGRADQEAVVPLAEDSRQVATLVWDDSSLTTTVSVVNPTSSAATVTIAVFDSSGASIGTTTLNIPAKGREAFVLRERPGLAGMSGKRGMARISVSAGAVSALGLRFAGEAITSIPVNFP